MGKELKLTSPIKVAGSMASVTVDKLDEGQVAICDDGTGALGIVGKAGGRLLRSPTGGNATQGKVPITLVTGPGYFAAPQGAIDPTTDSMVFYTMGCRSSSRKVGDKKIHIDKKRFARMGCTEVDIDTQRIWTNRRWSNNCVTDTLAKVERNAPRGTMDFFTASLSTLEAELGHKFTLNPSEGMLFFRLGSRRRWMHVSAEMEYAATCELARCTIGVAIERGGVLVTDIYPVHVAVFPKSKISSSGYPANLCFAVQFGQLRFSYTPVRRLTTRWEAGST